MTTLRDRLVKIGAKIVRHDRSITFHLAEIMLLRYLNGLRAPPGDRSPAVGSKLP